MRGSTRNLGPGSEVFERLSVLSEAEQSGRRVKAIDWLNGEASAPNLSSIVSISDDQGEFVSGMSSFSPCDQVQTGDAFNVQHLVESRSVYPIWIQQTCVFKTNIDFEGCRDGEFRDDVIIPCGQEGGIEHSLELKVIGAASDKNSMLDISGVLEAIAETAKGKVLLAQRKFEC